MFENVKDLWQRQHKASQEDLQRFVMCNQEEVLNNSVFEPQNPCRILKKIISVVTFDLL